MTINALFRQNVRTFYAWLGSLVLLGASPLVALSCIERDTALWRAAGVAAGTAGMLPWLWVLFAVIRRGDEFVRRMHLVAIAITAAAGFVLLVALGWLVRASFIAPPDLMVVWVGLLVLWVIALIFTKRHFEKAL